MNARGVLHVHACPPALCPHVTWAVARVLGEPIELSWLRQPALPGMLRAETEWTARPGLAGRLASALKGWQPLRFETVEFPTPGCDGYRCSYTGRLGLFTTAISANGDVMIGEEQLRGLRDCGRPVRELVDELLGAAWDAELEPLRRSAYGAPPTSAARVV